MWSNLNSQVRHEQSVRKVNLAPSNQHRNCSKDRTTARHSLSTLEYRDSVSVSFADQKAIVRSGSSSQLWVTKHPMPTCDASVVTVM